MLVIYGNLDNDGLKLVGKLRIVYSVGVCIVVVAAIALYVNVIGCIKLRKVNLVNVAANGTCLCCITCGILIKRVDCPLAVPYMAGTCLGHRIDLITVCTVAEIKNILVTVLRLGAVVCRDPIMPLVAGSLLGLGIDLMTNRALTLELGSYATVFSAYVSVSLSPITVLVAGTGNKCDLLFTANGTGCAVCSGNLAAVNVSLNLNRIAPCVTGALIKSDLVLAANRAVTDLTVGIFTSVHAELCALPCAILVAGSELNLGILVTANGTLADKVNVILTNVLCRVNNRPITVLVAGAGTVLDLNNTAYRADTTECNVKVTVGNNIGANLLPRAEYVLSGILNLIFYLSARGANVLELGNNCTVSSAILRVGLSPVRVCMAGTLIGLDLKDITSRAVADLAVDELTSVKADVSRAPLAPCVALARIILDLLGAAGTADTLVHIGHLAVVKAAVLYPLTPGVIGAGLGLVFSMTAIAALTCVAAKSGTICRIIGFISKKLPFAIAMALCSNGLSIYILTAISAALYLCTVLGTGGLYGNLPVAYLVVIGNRSKVFLLDLATLTRANHLTVVYTSGLNDNLPLAEIMDMLGVALIILTGCKYAYGQNQNCEQA